MTDGDTPSINGLFPFTSPIAGGINVIENQFRRLDNKYIEAIAKAQEIKETLRKENTPQAIAERKSHNDKMRDQGWTPISSAVDSAASGYVIPVDVADGYAVEESEGSKADQCWTSATGELIPNLGQRTLACLTREGTVRSMTYQVAPVEQPLNAVCDLMKCKHIVVFDDEGSFIRNKETGEINW